MAVLSVDLGGSHISCAVVHGAELFAASTMPTTAMSLMAELSAVEDQLRECVRLSGLSLDELEGLAIGFCGVVDGSSGKILSTLNKYTDAMSINLHDWAAREFNLPMRIQNDACLALLGEAHAGAARGVKDVVMVTLGTGIGGAAMLGGKLLRSEAGQAGCLGGHLPVNFRGRLCACGAIGCAESEASTAVLPLLCQQHPNFTVSALASEQTLNFASVFKHADAGDRVSTDVLEHCLAVWSVLAVGLIHAYGPALILFGGGVMQRGEQILEPIRNYVETHMWRTSKGLPEIRAAALGSKAALLGGAVLFANDGMHVGGAGHAE